MIAMDESDFPRMRTALAGQLLAGMLANPQVEETGKDLVQLAFRYADSLLTQARTAPKRGDT